MRLCFVLDVEVVFGCVMSTEFISVYSMLDADARAVLAAAEARGGDHPLCALSSLLQRTAAANVTTPYKFTVYSVLVKTSNISKLKEDFPEAFLSSPSTARETTLLTAAPSVLYWRRGTVQGVVQSLNLLWSTVQACVWPIWQRVFKQLTKDGHVVHAIGDHSMWERFLSAGRLMTVLVTIALLAVASLCCVSWAVCLLCWILSSRGGAGMRGAVLHVMRRQQAVPLSVSGSPTLSGLRAMLSLPAVHERKIGMAVLQARLDAQSVEIAGLNARMAVFDELVGRVQEQDAEIVRLRMTEANVTMMQAIATHQLMTCIARPAGPPPARDVSQESVVSAQAAEMQALRRRLEEQAVEIKALRRHTEELGAGMGILVLGLGVYLSTSVMSAMGWAVSDWFITYGARIVGMARPT